VGIDEIAVPGARGSALGGLAVGGAIAAFFVIAHTPELAVPFALVVPIAVREAMTRVWVDGDRLRVCNFWRTYELDRADIAGFGVGDTLGGRGGRHRTVFAQLADGSTRNLSATRRFYRKFLAFLPAEGKRNEADDLCMALNAWLQARV
jgi:hypothetical protein